MAKELEQTSYKLTKSRISNRNVVHGTEAQLKSTTLAAYNATMNKIIHFSAVLLPSARSRLSPKVFKKIETSPFLFILLFTYVISEEHRSQYSHIFAFSYPGNPHARATLRSIEYAGPPRQGTSTLLGT